MSMSSQAHGSAEHVVRCAGARVAQSTFSRVQNGMRGPEGQSKALSRGTASRTSSSD
jgi:hypothetical protein